MTRANTLPTMLIKEMPLYLLQSFPSPLVVYRVVLLESLVSVVQLLLASTGK